MSIKSPTVLGVISFCVFIIASLYITYPLIFHIGNMATGYGDELVIAWIQNWVIHALSTNPTAIFEANIYYPYHNTLAFSETFILTSILAIPIRLLIGEPIATVNFTLLSSIILLGFSFYLLCFYLTKDFLISLFAGLMVIFSPAVLDYSVHQQILSEECVPLSILFLLHFLKTQRTRFLAIGFLFFIFQMYNSILPSYFIVFAYIIILFFYWRANRKKTLKLISKHNMLLLITTFILIIPIAIPYFSVSNEFHYTRDIRDAIHFAIQPEDFLYPGNRTRLSTFLLNSVPTNQYSENGEFKPGYLGVIFSILVLYAFWYFIRNFKKNDIYMKAFFTIALVGLVTCLGPALHLDRHTVHIPFIIPLPYAVFYYVIPGFQGLRDSQEWNMFFVLGITVVIALTLRNTLLNTSFGRRVIVFILLFAGILIELNVPLKLYPVPQKNDFPKVYSWLATTNPNSNIIELPIYNWNMDPFTGHELWREYFNTVDFRRTINGYTGFSPPPWQLLISNLDSNFPSNETINTLKKLDITYVIIHTDEYNALSKSNLFKKNTIKNGNTIIKRTEANSTLKLVKKFKDTYVFKI